jgi:hypothetical protein
MDVPRTAYLVRTGKFGSRDLTRSLSGALKFASVRVVSRNVIIKFSLVLEVGIKFTELITQQYVNPFSNSCADIK